MTIENFVENRFLGVREYGELQVGRVMPLLCNYNAAPCR